MKKLIEYKNIYVQQSITILMLALILFIFIACGYIVYDNDNYTNGGSNFFEQPNFILEDRAGFMYADKDGALTNYFTIGNNGKVNLREISEELGMMYIDVMLNRITIYETTIDWIDFINSGLFSIGQQYADFTVVDIDIWDDISPVRVRINMEILSEDGANETVRVDFTFFYSQIENINSMGAQLCMMSAPIVFSSEQNVGDFTYGGGDFIRGNVHVAINRGIGGNIPVVDLAKAIDQQILTMLLQNIY